MPKMEMYLYKYIPKNLELTTDQTYKLRDGMVTYLNFIHDLTKQRHPVIQCGIQIETQLIKSIYDNKDKATLKLDVYEQQLDGKTKSVLGTRLHLQHEFSIIPMRDQNVYITAMDRATTEITDHMKSIQLFEMYLYDQDVINWFTQQISVNYKSATHAEALHAIFLERNIPAQIIVATPPINNREISPVTIPLQDLVHNVYHLNKTYGLYDCIPLIYYDFKYVYCVSKRKPNIEIDDATEYDNVTLILNDPQRPDHDVAGSYDDAEHETHWININEAPDIYDETTRDTSAKFSTVTSVDKSGSVNKSTIDGDKTALTYVYAVNDLSEDQMKNEFMTGHRLGLKAINCSVRFIKPYKDYTFAPGSSYENLKLDGNIYRLLGWVHGIHREGTTDYISELTLTLYNPEREQTDQ